MLRRIIVALILIGLAGALVWALRPQPVAVETAVIGRRTIEVGVEEEGVSRIREVFTVSAPIAGQLLRSALHAGDSVVANQTIVASIKPAEPGLLDARARRIAEAAVEAAAAAVDLAEAQLDETRSQLEFANSELQRATLLVSRGTIPERSFEKAKLDAAVAAAAVKSAEASLAVRQQELASARAALIQSDRALGDACCVDVRSPVSGRVLRVATESAQVVQPGTPLLDLGDPNDLEVVADVLSRDAVRIKPGAAASIEGWGGAPLAAEVSRIDPAAVTKVSALGIEEQRVTVVLKLTGDPAQWRGLGHGFRIVARISVWRSDNTVAVPVGALFRQGASWAVYGIAGGTARIRPITIGERNSEFAEVRSGLDPGDTVIVHPSDQVAEGTTVDVSAP